LIIHHAFINDIKTGPVPVAEYSSLLMNITQGRCYSHAEHSSLLPKLRYQIGADHDTVGDLGFMTAVKLPQKELSKIFLQARARELPNAISLL
jgi:hypothetical protein